MTKKFLSGMLAIAVAFGMTVIGCENIVDEDGLENHTLNLTQAGENAIFLTLKGATWKDPEGDVSQTGIKILLLESLYWDQEHGNISKLERDTKYDFVRTKAGEIKITFSKNPALGGHDSGSGTVKLKEKDTAEIIALLEFTAENIDLGSWTIGKNDPVPIDIK